MKQGVALLSEFVLHQLDFQQYAEPLLLLQLPVYAVQVLGSYLLDKSGFELQTRDRLLLSLQRVR